MRVMQVSQHGELRGGAEFHCLALTTCLATRGITVEAVCGDDGSLAHELRRQGVPVHVVPLSHYRIYEHMREEPAIDWPTVERITGLLREFRPDIVHSHLMPAHLHAALAALAVGTPGVLYTEHNFAIPATNVLLSRLSRAHTIVASRAASTLLQRDGVPPDRIAVIPHGFDPARVVTDDAAVAALRARLVPDGGPVIGTIARLSPEKAIDVLLRAAQLLIADLPDLTVLIAGDGPLEDELRHLAGELGIAASVRFLGFRTDAGALMRLMDVVVLPSRMENVGLVLLEAMALGRPVVATSIGAIPEYVDEDVGLLAPPDDPAALATTIRRLLDDPALRARLGAAGQARALKHYTLDRMVDRTIRVYERLIGRPPGVSAAPAI